MSNCYRRSGPTMERPHRLLGASYNPKPPALAPQALLNANPKNLSWTQAALSHQMSLTRHHVKDKIIKNFNMGIAEY